LACVIAIQSKRPIWPRDLFQPLSFSHGCLSFILCYSLQSKPFLTHSRDGVRSAYTYRITSACFRSQLRLFQNHCNFCQISATLLFFNPELSQPTNSNRISFIRLRAMAMVSRRFSHVGSWPNTTKLTTSPAPIFWRLNRQSNLLYPTMPM
jgi:hypothetical protein